MKLHIKLSVVGFILLSLLSPTQTIALENKIVTQKSVNEKSIDVTIPSSIELTVVSGQTTVSIPEYKIKNNSKNGVVTVSTVNIRNCNSWNIISYNTDFNKLSIDSKKFAVNYNNHDMTTSYTSPQNIEPDSTVSLKLTGKTSISSTDLKNNIANMILTLQYTETVHLDSLKVNYTEQPDSVININPDHLKVTAVYSNGIERILKANEYKLSTLTGIGEEIVKVTYTENEIIKEATFIVNNPYVVTLISEDSTNQKISYKFGVGVTLPQLTREGYNFDGWYDNNLFEGNSITQIDSTTKGNKTFYAKWSISLTKVTISESETFPQKIQFTVEPGTTWKQWIDSTGASKYNIIYDRWGAIYVRGNVYSILQNTSLEPPGNEVLSSDTIETGIYKFE